MHIIRPVSLSDLQILVEFSQNATLGLRNLPKDQKRLKEKIINSTKSFKRIVSTPGKEEYLFVLENISDGQIMGVCGILASADPNDTYSFRIETDQFNSNHSSAVKETKILRLISSSRQTSELCSLYLKPDCRHSGQGRLLSLSRLLFIASHQKRFQNTILAELRGVIQEGLTSPFWDAVGRHFCDISFIDLMTQLDQKSISIREFLPHFPIYICLLPKEAQDVIGKSHETTKPALKMLLDEGFEIINEVDALEAGPSLIASINQIRSINKSRLVQVQITKELLSNENSFLLANTELEFRACIGSFEYNENIKNSIFISENVANALQVKNGDKIRFVSLH
jgi:arginine N-succinyltransferase